MFCFSTQAFLDRILPLAVNATLFLCSDISYWLFPALETMPVVHSVVVVVDVALVVILNVAGRRMSAVDIHISPKISRATAQIEPWSAASLADALPHS